MPKAKGRFYFQTIVRLYEKSRNGEDTGPGKCNKQVQKQLKPKIKLDKTVCLLTFMVGFTLKLSSLCCHVICPPNRGGD